MKTAITTITCGKLVLMYTLDYTHQIFEELLHYKSASLYNEKRYIIMNNYYIFHRFVFVPDFIF